MAEEADARHDERRTAFREDVAADDTGRTEIELHRAAARATKARPTSSPIVCALRPTSSRLRSPPHRDVAQRIEELDRELELLRGRTPACTEGRRCRREENADRMAAALLGAVEGDGTGDLRVETGHRVPDHLRDPRHFRIVRFRVGAAEPDETVALFALFRGAERFVQKSLAMAAVIVLPPVGMLRLKIFLGSMKIRLVVRAPISTISEQPLEIAVVIPKGVVERHRRDIDSRRLHAGIFDRRR